jgi:2-hydroxycyclohexanecarboxyl-CoA dehydrogenase
MRALTREEPLMGRLNDKIAIVTGAGRGIGKAIVGKLAAERATVVVTDLDEATARETAAALPVAIRADVTDRRGVQTMVDRVLRQFGRIDVLVNNAGWDKAGPFVDSDPADWDRVIAINLYGVLHTAKAVLPIMAEQGSGAVVNLGSDAGRVGSSGEAVYSAAKGGVIAFTESLAREMARHQVRVNCVCPGPTDTALFASFAGRSCVRPSPRRSRSGGSATRPTSPTSSRSSPQTRRPSSPARPSASAAASR